jgi:hypothetical protein
MTSAESAEATWNHEQAGQTESVEALIRSAHIALESAGLTISPSKVSRRIRARVLKDGLGSAERMIASYAGITTERGSFDAYCLTYRDPVGETAARNLDAANWTERMAASR